jgi:hypothetical protein
MNAVGDKSPVFAHSVKRTAVRRPDADDILAPRHTLAAILDSAIGLAAGVQALRSIAVVS